MEQNIKDALTERIIEESGRLYGVERKKIKELGGFENFIYEFEQGGKEYILRLVHSTHRTFNAVEAEMEFIEYLSKEGASVSTVVHSIGDRIIEKVTDDNGGFFSVSAFTKAPGSHVKQDDITSEFDYCFGKEVAKLHVLTKTYKAKHKRHHWYEEDFVDIGIRSINEKDQFMIDKTKQLMEKIKSYPTTNDDCGLIHTDLHFGNMFYSNGTFTFFDWDDAAYKHFISDIAIIIFYRFKHLLPNQEKMERSIKEFLDEFMRGYLEINKLDFIWFERLNDFFKLREHILYYVLYAAGEEYINGPWAQKFINDFRPRIENDIDFINLENIVDFDKWNSY